MKTRSREYPKWFRYLYGLILIAVLSWILFFGQNSFFNTWQLKRKVDTLQEETDRLKVVNDSLARENERLKTDPDAAEKAAREGFGLTKPNEKVFRFVPAKEDE